MTLTRPLTTLPMASAPRLSIQMMALPMAFPSPPTGTVPHHCEVTDTPASAAASSGAAATRRCTARVMASHHSSGSCSAPPWGSRMTPFVSTSWATTLPCTSTRATLGPPVPRSMARMWSVTAGSPGGCAGRRQTLPIGPGGTMRVRSGPVEGCWTAVQQCRGSRPDTRSETWSHEPPSCGSRTPSGASRTSPSTTRRRARSRSSWRPPACATPTSTSSPGTWSSTPRSPR